MWGLSVLFFFFPCPSIRQWSASQDYCLSPRWCDNGTQAGVETGGCVVIHLVGDEARTCTHCCLTQRLLCETKVMTDNQRKPDQLSGRRWRGRALRSKGSSPNSHHWGDEPQLEASTTGALPNTGPHMASLGVHLDAPWRDSSVSHLPSGNILENNSR